MNKNLEQFSIKLENLLRNNKFIVENRDELLFFMFGGTQFEFEIKKILSNHTLYNYFLIGKILFLIDNIDESLKKTNKLIEVLKNKKYLIIRDDFQIENLENILLPIINEAKNMEKEMALQREDEWDSLLIKIRDLDVTVKSKINSKYFNFDNVKGNEFKLAEIITHDFEINSKQLFESKYDNYQNNKLENALFLKELTQTLKNRSIFDNCIGITKDKISDFKIISNNLSSSNNQWDNLSWKDIKNLKRG